MFPLFGLLYTEYKGNQMKEIKMKNNKLHLLSVVGIVAFAMFACNVGPLTIGFSDMPTLMPTLVVPTTVPVAISTPTPYPTTIPTSPPDADQVLLANGFVRMQSEDSTCSNACKIYADLPHAMFAGIYYDGRFSLVIQSNSYVDSGTQGRILGAIILPLYGPDMSNWLVINGYGLTGTRQGQVGNYKVVVQSTMSPDFVYPVIIVAIMPISSAYQYTPIPFSISTIFPTLFPTLAPTATSLPLGSSIDINNWEIKVEKVITTPNISAFNKTEKARGRFALVFMSITNHGYSPDTFVAFGNVDIMDAGGDRFEENSVASFDAQLQYNTDLGANINPDSTAHVVTAFDISLDSPYYLLIPGSLVSQNSTSLLLDVPKYTGH